jgi:DNA-binding transcriptional ArsR family regulator
MGAAGKGPALDGVFRALADPGRRKMVDRLIRGPASVSDLAAPLDMSLPAVLQHLAVLEDSGLVTSEKQGRVRTCRLDTKALRTAEQWIADRRATWERRLDRLGEYLDRTNPDRAAPRTGQTTDKPKTRSKR